MLTGRQQEIWDFLVEYVDRHGYPPTVREIGEAVGLSSSSTVHAHLAALQDKGYLTRDPTKPRAIEVRYDAQSGAAVDKGKVRHVPLLGDVAAGSDVLAQENVEEMLPLPADFTGEGQLFMVRVRGDSMKSRIWRFLPLSWVSGTRLVLRGWWAGDARSNVCSRGT